MTADTLHNSFIKELQYNEIEPTYDFLTDGKMVNALTARTLNIISTLETARIIKEIRDSFESNKK